MPIQMNWNDPYGGQYYDRGDGQFGSMVGANGKQAGAQYGQGYVGSGTHWESNPQLQAEYNQAKQAAQADNQLMSRVGPAIAQTDQANTMQARGNQEQALGMMRNAAMGNGPSVAQAQTYGNMGGGIAAMNAASQGRGANVAGQMGTGSQNMSGMAMQGANARSQEQAGLMGQYGKAAAGLNASDIGQYGMDLEQMNRARGLANQQAMLNANTAFGQNQMDMNQNLAKQAYLQGSNQLNQQAKNQATQQMFSGIGTGLGLMATTAALAA